MPSLDRTEAFAETRAPAVDPLEAAAQCEARGDPGSAIAWCRASLEAGPPFSPARRRLALLLVATGAAAEAAGVLRAELEADPGGVAWLTAEIVQAMQGEDLAYAGTLAEIFAALRYGADLPGDESRPDIRDERGRTLSAGKLEHDAQQLRYLRRHGVLGDDILDAIRHEETLARKLSSEGLERRRPLEPEDERRIGHLYGRLAHVRETPRIDCALSPSWDRVSIENSYLHRPPGIVVIDDFLAPEALDALRLFCLESTVWQANRYPHGRLGAFFLSGFSCPLLLQIAEEIRDAFPRIIGRLHPLRQLWGFKYPERLPADSTIHADFAAVNVNFWITPQSANADPGSGGMVIYDLDAPADWDFARYNERLDSIKRYLKQNQAKSIIIPYRQNRAVIFNSDLFHATAAVNFRPGYENRRINVTMLYGDRASDSHHPNLSGRAGAIQDRQLARPAWRSAARISRFRPR